MNLTTWLYRLARLSNDGRHIRRGTWVPHLFRSAAIRGLLRALFK